MARMAGMGRRPVAIPRVSPALKPASKASMPGAPSLERSAGQTLDESGSA